MIITRSWIRDFLDIDNVSNDKLISTLNSIGHEVDFMTEYKIPSKVVVGEILSVNKHPNADKLNVCIVDVGLNEPVQIVCGASNVVYAQYVAVAMVGADLGNGFVIKEAQLRGVDSHGMICSSKELGLPEVCDGIMILDSSIDKLIVGKELAQYPKIADTVIGVELTPNRGDCLSVHGLARDLAVALNLPLLKFEYKEEPTRERVGLARLAQIKASGVVHSSLRYALANTSEDLIAPLLIALRMAFVENLVDDALDNAINYTVHCTGVLIRAYDSAMLKNEENIIMLSIEEGTNGVSSVYSNGHLVSKVGINFNEKYKAKYTTNQIFFEVGYTDPKFISQAVMEEKLATDKFYYNASRGSEVHLKFGIDFFKTLVEKYMSIMFYDGYLSVQSYYEHDHIGVDIKELSSILGMEVKITSVISMLTNLGFKIQNSNSGKFGVTVPGFRHDITSVQDIAEEVMRMIGIDNIPNTPLKFFEQNRVTDATMKYKAKKELRIKAVANGFYETISYAFNDKKLLAKYNLPMLKEELELTNPITDELNTVRTSVILNLLNAVKRNVNYGQKRVPLFEIGTIFNASREEREVISFIWSGQFESETVLNKAKPSSIDFNSFLTQVSKVLGEFSLAPITTKNGLIHPYLSADILKEGKVVGFISALHPTPRDDFGIPATFFAQIDFNSMLPIHINAKEISNFQAVHKDLSLVMDKNIGYGEVEKSIKTLNNPLIRTFRAIDVYEDEALGDKKSLTIRFSLQSMEKTLLDIDIESVMNEILVKVEKDFGANLR
ncbi:MAG: phenylalanine--tRNA ligase subunit beta [Epsilonproteobacteria bacterium]|nr:phenylalanine--tRNA ligase subunit beta [Campylobacterota bacterium]MBD3839261.1 phenylalanine--tRNA ligase subunit beta [Campylobacterota bacterium]